MQLKITLTQTEVEKAISGYLAQKGYNVIGAKIQMLSSGGVEVTLDKSETSSHGNSYYDR